MNILRRQVAQRDHNAGPKRSRRLGRRRPVTHVRAGDKRFDARLVFPEPPKYHGLLRDIFGGDLPTAGMKPVFNGTGRDEMMSDSLDMKPADTPIVPPAPVANLGHECLACGWKARVVELFADPDHNAVEMERFHESISRHADDCPGRLHPSDEGTVTIPIAVYAKRDPHRGVPGTTVSCPQCKARWWFERSKHGSKMLLEAIDEHIGHTRAAR